MRRGLPGDCIYESERMHSSGSMTSIECGACAPGCLVEAIYPEDALPEKWALFVRINAAWRSRGAAAVERALGAIGA